MYTIIWRIKCTKLKSCSFFFFYHQHVDVFTSECSVPKAGLLQAWKRFGLPACVCTFQLRKFASRGNEGVNRLQKFQNYATCLFLGVFNTDCISPHFASLCRLPIDRWIRSKLAFLHNNYISSTASDNLREFPTIYSYVRLPILSFCVFPTLASLTMKTLLLLLRDKAWLCFRPASPTVGSCGRRN